MVLKLFLRKILTLKKIFILNTYYIIVPFLFLFFNVH